MRLMLFFAMAACGSAFAQVVHEQDLDLYGATFPSVMAPHPAGGFVVAGYFTRAADNDVRYLVRHAADGSVDNGWLPILDTPVDDIAIDSLGRVYVTMRWTRVGAGADLPGYHPVRRVLGDGSLDPAFVPVSPPNAIDDGYAMLLDEAGGALYASYSLSGGGAVLRRFLLSDGSLDPTFELQLDSLINDMMLSGDQILLGGTFRFVNGVARKGLARVDRLTGALDAAWDPAATSPQVNTVRSFLLDGNGHVFVGGRFSNFGGETNRGLARISLADGSADPQWSTPITGQVVALALDGQGRLIVSGPTEMIGGLAWTNTVARFSAAGVHEVAWDDPAIITGSTGRSVLVLENDDVLALHYSGGEELPRVLRHAHDTGLTSLFSGSYLGTPYIPRAVGLPDGGALLVSNHFQLDGVAPLGAFRIDADGAPVAGWRSDLGASLKWASIAAADVSSTHLYLAGYLQEMGGRSPVRRLALADGSLDTTWVPQTGSANTTGTLVAIDEAGGFAYVAGSLGPSGSLARFQLSDGARDVSWAPSAAGFPQFTQMQLHDGHLYVSGYFTTLAGLDLPRLARYSTSGDGSPDPDWRPAPDGAVAIALDPAGDWIYAGGGGPTVSLSRHRLSDASHDSSWTPLDGRAGFVSRLALDAPAGALFAIGDLAVGCGGERLPVVRLHSGPSRIDALWSLALDPQGSVLEVVSLGHSHKLVAGEFESINGEARRSVALLDSGDSIFADGGGDAGGCVVFEAQS